MDETYFTPRQVTDPNDILDEKSILFIRNLFLGTQAVANKIESHNNSPNTDGRIDLIDDEKRPFGCLIIQAKTYKTKYKGKSRAEIPAYFVAYADRMRNETCLFFSVDADSQKIFWKYISEDYINDFKKQGDNAFHIYHFSKDEIVCKENVESTIVRWKQIFAYKLYQFTKNKRNAEEIVADYRFPFKAINTDFHNLKNSFIERDETGKLYDWIKKDLAENESNLKLLVGGAGMGKSVVIKEVIRKLDKESIKCFAIKADRLPSSIIDNELLESLKNTFCSFVQDKKAVLIVDQIDALSQYITSDRTKLECVIALVNHFVSNNELRNVRIIVSCRSFDLEFDPKLSLLEQNSKINIGVLSKDEVKEVLDKLKDGLSKELDERTITILQAPQHLNLFCQVFARNKKTSYFSITDLYDELWRQTIDFAPPPINKSKAENVLYCLAQKIYEEETLTPQWEYDTENFKESNYLVSNGIIEQSCNTATFFHQSMYDYVFARYNTKGKRRFVQEMLAEKKHQGLFLRSTINMVLDYERTKNVKQYKEDVNTILFSQEVRPHIQLMVLWEMANRSVVLPFEKKCIRMLYEQNKLLFYSFIKRTCCKDWYDVIIPLISDNIRDLKKDDSFAVDIYSFLLNHVQNNTESVYKVLETIKDEKSRKKIAQRILYATSDFSNSIVTKWYAILCNSHLEKADFLEQALPSNPMFVLEHISDLIFYILSPQKEETGDNDHSVRRIIEDICSPLKEKYPDIFYPILRDVIIDVINNNRISVSWREEIDYNNVFPSLMNYHHSPAILKEWFCEMLRNRVNEKPDSARNDVHLLLHQKEECCYEFAFSAMNEDPRYFSEEIISILQNQNLLDELLTHCDDASYYLLEIIKKWLPLVDNELLTNIQNLVYNYKSSSDLLSDKERRYTRLLYPHLGYNQRKLLWAIPENLRNDKNNNKLHELNRRFGDKWNNKKPDHGSIMASVCGGLMSLEQYKTVTFDGWRKSFYGIQRYAKGKDRFIDERVHADAFKQCVCERPEHFDLFVFNMFEDEKIPILYKLSGLDGLVSANYPLDKVLPYLWRSMDFVKDLSKDGYSYRIFDVIDKITTTNGEHIEKIKIFLRGVILMNYESKYNPSVEDAFGQDSGTNDMLMYGINSPQGYAIHSFAKIGKLPSQKENVYKFFIDLSEKMSLEHQLATMFYLRMECYDNNLYNEVMFKTSTKPISDYLFLNADIMHWFLCHNPELIMPYFSMLRNNRRSRKILVQIMFFGMQYDKSKANSKEFFEDLLSHNEEEIIEKVIPLAYQNLSDNTYGEQSEEFLRRYANDCREKVRDSYIFWCKKMPENRICLFKELLENWLDAPIKNGLYDIVHYLKKSCHKYPYECFQCIQLLMTNNNQLNYYEEEIILKILLNCYRVFLDEEETEKAESVMDLLDTAMLKTYTPSMSKIIKEIDNNRELN